MTAPTCTEQGYTTYTCSRCGDSYVSDYVDASHQSSEWKVDKEATCTENGHRHKVCEVCGTELEIEDIPALGHVAADPVRENEITATCTSEGSYDEVVYCRECGEELSREHVTTAKTEHQPSEWITDKEATEYEEGHRYKNCLICGEILEEETIPALSKQNSADNIGGCGGSVSGFGIMGIVLMLCASIRKRKISQ